MKRTHTLILREELCNILRFYSTIHKITITKILTEAFKEYLKENKKKILKKIEETNKIFVRKSHKTDSKKERINLKMNKDDYYIIKMSASLEQKTISQKVDEIVCDYINKYYSNNDI